MRRAGRHGFVLALWLGLAAAVAAEPLGAPPDYLIDNWQVKRGFRKSPVTSLSDAEGYLWLGTFNGLARFDGVRFAVFNAVNTPPLAAAGSRD